MAQLARLRWEVYHRGTLRPVQGASVEVRKQGATCDGIGSGSPLTVNDPGAIVVDDQIRLGASSSPTRNVSAISATTISCGVGFNVADDDRLTVASPLPTLYNDATGSETKTQPLLTDINGVAECWIIGGKYDLLVSKSGVLTTTLYTDVASVGGERHVSNIHGGAGFGTAWNFDTLRTLDSGDAVFRIAEAGSARFTIFKGGGFTSGGTNVSTISGALTVNGLLTTAASISNTGTITSSSGITATTGNIQATAGDFDGRRMLMNNGTVLVAGDFALGAGWGSTASIAFGGASAYDTHGYFAVTAGGAGIAANPNVVLTFKDGAFPQADRKSTRLNSSHH